MAYIGVSPSNGVRRVHTYTATASQTTFSGAGAEGTSLSYKDSNFVDVYQNGIKLGDADYTSTSGTSIVLAQGASVDDLVVVVVFDVFSVADTVSKADGGTFDGNVTMAGTLGVTGATTLTGALTVNDPIQILNGSNVNTASTDADDLIIEGPNDCGLSILSATTGRIFFGDASNDDAGSIRYVHSDDSMRFEANDEEAMRIHSIGAVTKPLQPAFSAYLSSTSSALATDGSAVTVAFASERFDTNSDFASNTFTAPVTGKYLLAVHLRINNADSAATYYIPTLVTSNNPYRDIINPTFSSDPGYMSMQVTVVADMDANDTAYVTIQQSGGSSQSQVDGGNDYTYFTGYLLG